MFYLLRPGFQHISYNWIPLTDIFHLKVPESTPVASLIGRIKANDADIRRNANIDYSIVPGDGLNVFDITSDKATQEGVISLKKVRTI